MENNKSQNRPWDGHQKVWEKWEHVEELVETGDTRNLPPCTAAVCRWFLLNGLCLNPNKSEAILLGTPSATRHSDNPVTVNISGNSIPVSSTLKSFGVTLDSQLSFHQHVNSVCKISYLHLRSMRHVRSCLPPLILRTVACSIISAKLDYFNSLLYVTTHGNIHKLQLVQNSLARLVTGTRKFDHISPVLAKLHWLPVSYRITYKIAVLTHKTLSTSQPGYLSSSIHRRHLPDTVVVVVVDVAFEIATLEPESLSGTASTPVRINAFLILGGSSGVTVHHRVVHSAESSRQPGRWLRMVGHRSELYASLVCPAHFYQQNADGSDRAVMQRVCTVSPGSWVPVRAGIWRREWRSWMSPSVVLEANEAHVALALCGRIYVDPKRGGRQRSGSAGVYWANCLRCCWGGCCSSRDDYWQMHGPGFLLHQLSVIDELHESAEAERSRYDWDEQHDQTSSAGRRCERRGRWQLATNAPQ